MNAEMTNFLEVKALNLIFRNDTASYTPVATVYAALASALSSDGDSITEFASANGYARTAMAFGAASGKFISNSGLVSFPAATGNQGTAKYVVVYDAATAGNPLFFARIDGLYSIVAVSTGSKTFSIAGDYTANFGAGVDFTVQSSTGNDGTYTVVSSTFTGGNTVITVSETIPNATADGSVNGPKPVAVNTSVVFRIAAGQFSIRLSGAIANVAGRPLADDFLNWCLRNASWTAITTLRFGLLTAWTSETSFTEVTGGSYARIAPTYGTSAAAGEIANSADNAFPAATADWGTVLRGAWFDAASGGNLLWQGAFASGIAVPNGFTFNLPSGSLKAQWN